MPSWINLPLITKAVEASNSGIVIADAQIAGNPIVYCNPAFEKITGYCIKEVIGHNCNLLQGSDTDEKVLEEIWDSLRAHQPCTVTLKNYRKDQQPFWNQLSISPISDEKGTITHYIGILTDITEKVILTEALIEKNRKELEQNKRDSEQFGYIISHDLQEPLRMVSSYLQLIKRKYQGKLDPDADDFIAFAVDGAKRMQEMIQSLLDYSRVWSRGKELLPVNSQFALEKALGNLEDMIKDENAVIETSPLPFVMADEGQLVQLFQNLVNNAIKFKGESAPRIKIDVAQKEGMWEFSVHDNGIGIENKYFDRIFVIFQRLNDRERYPGTGIGLSICNKIVERHQGRIWVESTPGQGSIFRFTLCPV